MKSCDLDKKNYCRKRQEQGEQSEGGRVPPTETTRWELRPMPTEVEERAKKEEKESQLEGELLCG